jgi:hypothetical protein
MADKKTTDKPEQDPQAGAQAAVRQLDGDPPERGDGDLDRQPNTGSGGDEADGGDAEAGAEPIQLKSAVTDTSEKSLRAKMVKLVGVKDDQVLGFNAERRTLVTSEGGKYKLSADGKQLIHLMGPAPKSDHVKE